MKLTQITLAVAMLVAAGSVAAAPVTPADIASARSASTLDATWLSGASAQAQVVYFGFRDTCDAGTVSIFTNDSSGATAAGSLGNFVAYACKVGARTKVVYHTMDGGSFNAYAPHTNGLKLDRLKELSANTACTLAGTYASGVVAAANVYNKCGRAGTGYVAATGAVSGYSDTLAPAKPAGGFSDVESNMFSTLLAVKTSTVGTEADVGLTQGFGVVVNTTLYRTLQVNQGLYASIAAATSADPSFSPANAPNITSAQYTSIASGTYSADWAPLLPVAAGLTSPGAGKGIYLARRVDTSGTQAASNVHFLKAPCSGDPAIFGKLDPVAATVVDASGNAITAGASAWTAGVDNGALNVFTGAGTTDVKVAITLAETQGKFAVGVVSLENNPATETNAARKEYHFVKLDGIHPELGDATYARAQMVSGAYAFQYETKSFIATGADSYGKTLIPAIVKNINTSVNCTTDPISRGLALTAGGVVPTSCQATMVSNGTRSGNSCTAIQLF